MRSPYHEDTILDVVEEQLESLTLEEHGISKEPVGESTYAIQRRLWDLGYKDVGCKFLCKTLKQRYHMVRGVVWNSKRQTSVLLGYKLKQLVP